MSLAFLSGVLLVLSFPNAGHPACAWIALVPLAVAVARASTTLAALRLGLVAGGVHFAGVIYWIPAVMIRFGDVPTAVAWLVHAMLVFCLAVFVALFALALKTTIDRFGNLAVLWTPVLWVTSELGRTHLFTGFPWELLGYSQASLLPVAQMASVTGVLGVSALIALVNGSLAFAVLDVGRRRWLPCAVSLGVVGVVVGAGQIRLTASALLDDGTTMRVAAVQGNVAQEQKWDPRFAERTMSRYADLTEMAAAEGAALVVWPEAATPSAFGTGRSSEEVRALAALHRVHLLFGTTIVEGDTVEPRSALPRYYNAAVMLDRRGQESGTYRKQHLVPWGEYVPFEKFLSFVSPLVQNVGGFSAGGRAVLLPIDDAVVGTAICYEIIFPGLVRQLTTAGSQLLVTISNDAWYGRTAAPEQHFQMASMRAIEQGRYLVRAANTGISGVIDPYGRVLERSALFEEAVVIAEVRLLDRLTVFARLGDLMAISCGGMTGLLLVLCWRSRGMVLAPRSAD